MATNRKLGRTTDIRNAMLKTLTTDLILKGKVETTEARAKEVKAIADSIIALAIKENVGYLLYKMNREQIISLYDESKIRENEYKGTDKEIQSFTNYYYKSLKGQLLKGRDPSFFVSKNEENQSKLLEEDEEGEEI